MDPKARFSINFGVSLARLALTMFPATDPALSQGTEVDGIANTYEN